MCAMPRDTSHAAEDQKPEGGKLGAAARAHEAGFAPQYCTDQVWAHTCHPQEKQEFEVIITGYAASSRAVWLLETLLYKREDGIDS